jgi:Ca2+-binding RTX toxin-like protein
MFGDAGNDSLDGTAGNGHTLSGGDGNDTLIMAGGSVGNGDGGHDKLTATTGDNDMWGGVGNDTLWAGTGNDTLHGGAGFDVMITNPNGTATTTTKMFGDSGNDTFEITSHLGNSTVSGGLGSDAVIFDARTSASATIVTGGGGTTVTFADTNQVVTVTGVEELVFTDTVINL